MTKTPLHTTICYYCKKNKAVWYCEGLKSGIVRVNAPLCNSCSNLPTTILIDQLISKPKTKK